MIKARRGIAQPIRPAAPVQADADQERAARILAFRRGEAVALEPAQ